MSAITTATVVGISTAAAAAGSAAYAAKKQAGSAREAAALESSAADKALAQQKVSYEQHRQDMAPYQQAGAGALGRLQQQSQAPRQTFDPQQPQGQPRMPSQPPMASLGNPMGGAPMVPRGTGPGLPPGGPQTAPSGPMMPGQGAGQMPPQGPPQGPQGGQMVMMQGPDGAKRPVPAQYAPQLQAKGFTVIQGG